MKEQFRDIPGFEGIYKISPSGRILSVKRGIIRKQYKNPKDGYWRVSLHKDGKVYTIETHKLVALAWLEKPEGDENWEIDHINADKDCNEVSNLEWVTHQENSIRCWELGNHKPSSINHLYEITRDGVFVDYARSQREAARKCGISATRMWYCLEHNLTTSTGFDARLVY